MKRLKVLILIPFLTGYGGTETVIHNLLYEYNKKKDNLNINIELYSLGGYINGDWLKFPNVKVIHLPKNRYIRELLYLFILPLLICYSILKNKPNFILLTNPIMWTIAEIISKCFHLNNKIIAWYHYSYKLKPIKPYYLKQPDYFFSISKSGEKELISLGIPSNKIFVIYNPIIPTKKIIKPSINHNQFIYVGRLEYKGQKNISELFKALSLIKNKTWSLKIYGTGVGKTSLEKLSVKLGIDKNIKWMGFVENPLNSLTYADALILTSTYEGFSMVLAESISRGLYVVSSNCPVGPKELINGYNGRLYELGHITYLAQLLNNILKYGNRINAVDMKKSLSKCYVSNYLKRLILIFKKI